MDSSDSRQMMVTQRRTDNKKDTVSPQHQDDDSKKAMGSAGRTSRILGVVCFVALFAGLVTHSGKRWDLPMTMIVPKKPSALANYYHADLEKVLAKYENCQVKWTPPPPKTEWDTKPLWMPAFPGSGATGPAPNGDILKPLINGITGLKSGLKNFHASGKNLKRCRGVEETAVCTQGHPVTDVAPARQVENFHHSVLLLIRNFRTAFPVFNNDKAEAYHGSTGQVDEEEWRDARDQWYKETFQKWKSVITAWRQMKEYDIGMYLQYEELMDPHRGPAAVRRLAGLLQSAGFVVAPPEDLPCIWFQVVRQEHARLREFCKYTPGYTKEQRDYMLKELKAFQKEVGDNQKLVAILKEYYKDIRDNTYIDLPHKEK